jgi:TPR repeat protein
LRTHHRSFDRHGWGCEPNLAKAVTYLSRAAANSAEVEALALQAGMKKGGAAKGELVLAIFELANCFRNGWGVKKDAFAAKQYYETAANLGDTDAMNEIAWCYLEGFGCKKDKVRSTVRLILLGHQSNRGLGSVRSSKLRSICALPRKRAARRLETHG